VRLHVDVVLGRAPVDLHVRDQVERSLLH
jgi:hypothetical protein